MTVAKYQVSGRLAWTRLRRCGYINDAPHVDLRRLCWSIKAHLYHRGIDYNSYGQFCCVAVASLGPMASRSWNE